MIEIDGSKGEGGGQIVRSSLALSAVTGQPFRIQNVRGGRKRPGLLKQHLTAVNAAREICGGDVMGNELNSSEITFAPGPIQTRGFKFQIGSAGSATLVAQTVLPALIMASGKSSMEIEGGTHNTAAPPYDFLERVYLPQVASMGVQCSAAIEAYGFYPAGGGRIKIDLEPCEQLKPLEILERKDPNKPRVIALVSQLPSHIAERECDVIRRKAGWNTNQTSIQVIENSPGPGNVVMIEMSSSNVNEIVTGFGKRGVKAEDVARNAYREAKHYLECSFPVGEHLADQLLLLMGLAAKQGKTSRIRTCELSQHSKTHLEILQRFLEIAVSTEQVEDQSVIVTIAPKNSDGLS